MAAFRDTELLWQGATYELTPSNRLLRRIEGQLSPSTLGGVCQQIIARKPPVNEISFIWSCLLGAAKMRECEGEPPETDEDSVYIAMEADIRAGAPQFVAACFKILEITSPTAAAAKN